ncbi:TPA: hypothetical protein QDB03_004266 [Burkholderia vietnamiensis]|uniref:hypothetical protein n=1 Tax=Burkholderia vietnamiensis TaxID=60552 RepID=UPI001B9E9CE9|nr:hypothetical protein [Burkholderia vietnamiensis]MBR8360957.1 hypothetical protein [Burkholderia vietnamiensis]UKV71423.1 hypothetical protein FOC29_00140 [Burkholderia vietnamiensis]HDR9062628.1 hypothetical protein [Burkholderia vietnamiensis]HDR9158893.1 hypothetical protein [Burkholderia vietnamiensis]
MSDSTEDGIPQAPIARRLSDDEQHVDEIVRTGPKGALALAGIATFIVIAMWFAFYFLVFLPRGVIQ